MIDNFILTMKLDFRYVQIFPGFYFYRSLQIHINLCVKKRGGAIVFDFNAKTLFSYSLDYVDMNIAHA